MEPNLYEEGDRTAVDAIVEQSRVKMETLTQDGTPLLLHDDRVKLVDLGKYMMTPTRRQGTITFDAVDSFVTYIKANKETAARIYVDADYEAGNVSATAVLNDDGGMPGWRDYRAVFKPKHSIEWKRWLGANKRAFSQLDFASFIEDNVASIISKAPNSDVKYPSGSDMLQMALSLELINDSRIKSSVRLQSGGYELTAVDRETGDTEKKMQVFERFLLGLRPFVNLQAYSIEARLRYKQTGAAITFAYELVRPDLVLEEAVKGLIIAMAAAEVPVLFGACPARTIP